MHCVAQLFPHPSSQVSIFDFCGLYNIIQIKVFYNISFPKDRCEVIMTDENDVATCNDLTQILRHKLECLILKCMDTWLDINRQLARSALQNTLMLDLPLQQYSNQLCHLLGYHNAFPKDKKTSHFYLQKSAPSPGVFWLSSGMWRNAITCAYLFGISYRPRELNSNTFLDSSNCFLPLRKKQSTHFGSIRKLCSSTVTKHIVVSGLNWIYEIQVLQISLSSFTLL